MAVPSEIRALLLKAGIHGSAGTSMCSQEYSGAKVRIDVSSDSV